MAPQATAVSEARAALARIIRDARVRAALSRRELATRMGYRNVSKGCARLASWERGEDVPRGDRAGCLARALPTSAREILAAVAREVEAQGHAQETQSSVARADRQATDEEARLLVTHREALSRALRSPDGAWLHATRLSCARVSLAYIGGRVLRLGELLSLWDKGALHAPCGCHGASMPVFAVAGSPLSGTHHLRGVCSVTGEVVVGRHSASTLLEFVRPVLGLLGDEAPPGPPLDGALRQAGCVPPPIHMGRLGGDRLGTWFGEDEVLRDPDGAVLAVLPWAPVEGQWAAARGPARSGGHMVLGSLYPPRFGAWRAEECVVKTAPHTCWRAAPGHLMGPDESPKVLWSRRPPPRVIAWLVHHLAVPG